MTAVQITRLRPDARIPAQAYDGDAGLDLSACERIELAPGERAVVGTGIAVAIPRATPASSCPAPASRRATVWAR